MSKLFYLNYQIYTASQLFCNCSQKNTANWKGGLCLRHSPCKMVSDAIKYDLAPLSTVLLCKKCIMKYGPLKAVRKDVSTKGTVKLAV